MTKTIIAICVLAFILLFCGCSTGKPLSDETGTQVPEPPADTVGNPDNGDSTTGDSSPAKPEEHPYEYILSPDFDRQSGITIPQFHLAGDNVAFDFAEWGDEYPSGEWSFDDLEKKYGKANEISGSIATNEYIEISGTWDNIYVLIRIPRNGTMSFDGPDSDPRSSFYPLSVEDMAVKLPVYMLSLWAEDMPLPRGLIIGQSTFEEVVAAYPVEGDELKDDPVVAHNILYKYVYFDRVAKKQEIEKADLGYVQYYFPKGILSAVEINWPSEYRSIGI